MRHLQMTHAASLCACLVLATLLIASLAPVQGANRLTEADCLRAIDKSVTHMDRVDIDTAQQGLATLAHSCEDVPQIHHNMGVLAARRGQWEEAILAFEKAIALAPQTADTVRQLNALHEYQAKKAWQVALDYEQALVEPTFTWQTSSDQNKKISADEKSADGLRSVATIDFELYTWWQAWDDTNNAAWLDHYVKGYPPPVHDDARPVPWDSVTKDIQFTASDAAVVLTWTKDNVEYHRWLLLTLAGQRWQIYHEGDF